MDQTIIDLLKKDGKCCISGKPMATSEHINFVVLDYAPDWAFPFEHNLLMPEKPKRALGIIHDEKYDDSKKYVMPGLVKFAIEIRGKDIIYHPVETLQPIRYADEN